ncbi:MAG: 3-oxoadipate enol-lactonase [Pseudomonadota bacterium]
MARVSFGDITLNVEDSGTPDAPAVVFSNSLGTTLHMWDPVIPFLPEGLRLIRYDRRGHGLSDTPDAPYTMGQLVRDTERVVEHCQAKDIVFVGLSIGGLVAQGLATKRPDLVRAMVLSNTGAKIGTPQMWQERIDDIGKNGLEWAADAVMERWFSEEFRASPELDTWRQMLVDTPLTGYLGCSAAIAGTDFFSATAALTLPTLAIAGTADGSTPPDLVRETGALIEGSSFHLIRGAGHLPCIERPEEYGRVLTQFFREAGHI